MNAYLSTHYLELTASLTGMVAVFLVARESILNWFIGLICVSLYFIIFYQVKLYADMGLQVIFFSLQLYGLYQWRYGGNDHTKLAIQSATLKIYALITLSSALLFLSIAYLLTNYTDSTTIYLDAFTTALSIVAQALMGRKWLQHWLLWMIVDSLSIYMYAIKSLYLTCGLYAVFLVLCIYGYREWQKQINAAFSS